MKNKIIARNVHEEDGDHQQHEQEKHDHKDDKREDCQEH